MKKSVVTYINSVGSRNEAPFEIKNETTDALMMELVNLWPSTVLRVST